MHAHHDRLTLAVADSPQSVAPPACQRRPSAMTTAQVKNFTPALTAGLDLALTTYGSLLRIPALKDSEWRFAILDEAQAIKNPGAKQTRAAKALRAQARIVLTGTPIS